MAKPFMNCNFKNCGVPLTKFAWITRCSHVFCDEHGEMFLARGGSRVRCPACNEVKNRETDVVRNDLNPSDLLISPVRPGKALEFALHAVRLWTHQMEYRRRCQTDHVVRKYEAMAAELTVKLQAENKELKHYILDIERKLKQVNEELHTMKARLNKYKSAYHSTRASTSKPRTLSSLNDMNPIQRHLPQNKKNIIVEENRGETRETPRTNDEDQLIKTRLV